MTTTPMKTLIDRLFDTAKEIDNPLATELRKGLPANARPRLLECQLVLKSGYAAAGVLTTTAEDMLRLASIAQTPDKKVVMVDQYFAYEDVETISLGRELSAPSVTPIRNGGGPIIIG